MRVQVPSLIALGTFLLIFVTVQYAYALPTEQRTDIVFFSEVDNTTEAQPEYVTVITEYNNGTESEVIFETNDVLMERLSRRFPERASDLEVCLPKVFCGINSNSQSLITHNNYKFSNLLKGLETLSSEEDTADKKSSEASESESAESSEEYGPYTGFRMAKSLSKKSQKDKPKKASTPKAKTNSSEQFNHLLYLEKKQRELEQTKDMSAVIQLASEIGHKLRSPRQCRNLFPSCGLSYAQITKLISDTEKPSTTPKPKASSTNQNKKAEIKVKPTVEPPKVEPATEPIPEQPAPPVKGRDGLDTSEEENDDIEYVVDTEIQPMKKYNLFSDNEPDKENSDGHQDELANDEETFTKYANSFPDKKQKPIVDIFGNFKNGKPGTKPGKEDKLAQKKLENKKPSDSSEEDEEETPESSAEAQKYSYRSETPYSNGQSPHYPAPQGYGGPGHGGPGHGGPGHGGPGHGGPGHGGPGFGGPGHGGPGHEGLGHGAPGRGRPEPMPGNGGMYPHNQQRPLGPGPYYDEPQSNEDEEENDEGLTRVPKSKKNGQQPTPYGGSPVQHPGPASSEEEEDSGEGDKSAEIAPSAAPFSPVAGAYSNQNPTYAHSPYQPFGGPSGAVKPQTPPPGQPGEPQTFDESLEEDEEEEADEPEPEEEVKVVKNKKNDNKSKSKSDVKKNGGKNANKKEKKNTKNGSSEERSLEADPYIKAHEVTPPKPEPPGLFTRFFNSFSGPEGSEEGPAGPRPTNGYGNGPGPTNGYGNRPGPGFSGNPQGYGGRPQGFGNRPEGPPQGGPPGPTRSGYEGEEANDDEPDNEGEEHSSEEDEEDDEDQEEENDEDNDEEEEKPKQNPKQKKNQKQNKNKDHEQDEEHDPDNEQHNDEEPKREQPPLPEVVVPENEETEPPLSESPFPPNPDADSIATPSIGNNKTNKKYSKKAKKPSGTKKPVQLMDTKDLSSEENKSEYEEDDIDSSKQVTGNGNGNKKNANSNQGVRPLEHSDHSAMQDNNGSGEEGAYSHLSHIHNVHTRQHLRNHNQSPNYNPNLNTQSMQMQPQPGVPTYSTYFQNIFGAAASDKSEEGSIMDDFDKIASSFTTSADKPSEWSDEEGVKNIKVPELKTPPRKYVVKKKSLKKKQAVRAHQQVQSKSKVTTANTSKDYSSEEDDER